MKKIKKDTIIRTIILIIALTNQVLAMRGKSFLPITDDQINDAVTLLFTIIASLASWWKNNSFTQAAIEADELKDKLKKQED